MITRHQVATRIAEYLQHHLTLDQLVEWAETSMMEAEFDETDLDALRETIGRIGLGNVKEFGLTWEDCETLLARLGYRAHVQLQVLDQAEPPI